MSLHFNEFKQMFSNNSLYLNKLSSTRQKPKKNKFNNKLDNKFLIKKKNSNKIIKKGNITLLMYNNINIINNKIGHKSISCSNKKKANFKSYYSNNYNSNFISSQGSSNNISLLSKNKEKKLSPNNTNDSTKGVTDLILLSPSKSSKNIILNQEMQKIKLRCKNLLEKYDNFVKFLKLENEKK
jgi:hypothetical protein